MNEKKLRPCDCKDMATAMLLEEQGVGHNDQSIRIEPNSVVLTMGHTEVKIPMDRFKMFAEWYLTEQELSANQKTTPPNTMDNLGSLYYRYGRTMDADIRNNLEGIKLMILKDSDYFEITDELRNQVLDKPRNVSFSFNGAHKPYGYGKLKTLKIVPFLVKSSSRFFFKPDIGEVFDQIDWETDYTKIKAICIHQNNYESIKGTDGEHFICYASLLTDEE